MPQVASPLKAFSVSNAEPSVFYEDSKFKLLQGDSLEVMETLPVESFDLVFADPPYMLSNNGITCQNGRMVSVNKGKWDKSDGFENDIQFHELWISKAKRLLKPNGTIWISGTYHSIYQCGFLLQKLGFHILNDIAWYKPNASPNLSCRFFTASHETLIWAKKDKSAKHYFDYETMKQGAFPKDFMKKPDTQMRSVWSIATPPKSEKDFGKHPTQKPLALLTRILKASTPEGSNILDPFCGSGTTGVAAGVLGNRSFTGIDLEEAYLEIARKRIKTTSTSGLF